MASRIIRRLRDLVDVTFGTPADGDVVTYDQATDKLILSTPAAASGSSSLLGLTDVTGADGAGKAPVSDGADTFTLTDIATQAELDTHAADTTSVHGITDTSVLETTSGAQSKSDAARSAAEAYTDSSVSALSTVYQPVDADLTAIAALATTTFGRALLALADAAALRTAAGLGSAATSDTTAFDSAGAAATAETVAEAYTDTSVAALSSVYQPLDSDLTAVAGLTPTNDDVLQRKAGAWTNRTVAQLISDLAALGTTFQPLDSDLTSIAALSTTSYGRNLLTLANSGAADWVAKSTLTTKGDILAASAASTPARLGVGSNGQLLVADSAQTVGVKWGSLTGYTLKNVVVITASETYTPPSGVVALYVECIGGGGAGGGTPATSASGNGQCAAAGGGRAGSYAASFLTSLLSSYTVTIGAGGTGSAGAAGGNGSDTSFGTAVIAGSGKGAPVAVKDIGVFPDTSGSVGGANNASTGDLVVVGGISAGGNILSAVMPVGGIGGPAPKFCQVRLSAGVAVTGAGSGGSSYGGGGSGATAIASAAAQKGGDGAAGIVVIHEYIQT